MKNITEKLHNFAKERDWLKFHTPKNLLIALVAEVGELAEQMQWKSDNEIICNVSDDIKHEIADVAIYLLRLADVLGIDIEQAVNNKIDINAKKYPIEKCKGISTKYSQLY